MKTVFVTGVNGFVGKHVVRELNRRGARVIGVGLKRSAHTEIGQFMHEYYQCDLADQLSVDKLPWDKASAVISLAGLAQVGASYDNSELYNKVNVDVLVTICRSVLNQKLSPRIIAISTGAVYDSAQPMPLIEASRLITNGSPYALSKIAMEQAAAKFRKKGVDCIVVRPFNHIGPGQGPGFLLPDLYERITKAMATGEPVKVGNLATRRDYTDVRDVVRAYSLLAIADSVTLKSPVYNICSGQTHSGQEIFDRLIEIMGANGKVKLVVDPKLKRPNDPAELVGSSKLITADVGWSPEIAFEQTITDFVKSKTL